MASELFTLGMLILLQIVLGFDNLLYISILSKQAPENKQKRVQTIGIGIAIFLRIGLLFLIVNLIPLLQGTLLSFNTAYLEASITTHSLIVLAGGLFIIYTSVKEIWHMMNYQEDEHLSKKKKSSLNTIIFSMVLMNLVFSFDSILSAIALTDVFWVMATAIVIGGLLMIYLSDKVTTFLKKNRMYEVLGLFILFVVGIMLISEGGHLAKIVIAGSPIHAMSKGTFYFVIGALVLTDLVQSKYQKNLNKSKA